MMRNTVPLNSNADFPKGKEGNEMKYSSLGEELMCIVRSKNAEH